MATSKLITSSKVEKLAYAIKREHRLLNMLEDKLKAHKAEIIEASKEVFFADVDKDVPELVQNHEYFTRAGTVTVNFKMVQSKALEEMAAGVSAVDYLKGKLGDVAYAKLFKEFPRYEVLADKATLITQAKEKPELFNIRLREDITAEEVMKIARAFPQALTIEVRDVEEYAKQFPTTKKSVGVKVVSGFIDAADKLSGEIKSSIKGFLCAFIKKTLAPAVICGNASK